ncbi:MAG: hypothetical protein IJK14_06545 [Clostridia bacterium]|nr:hypothetical protein [Clostridia bacterium]
MEDRYSNAFDKVCASDEFKNRMKTIMREMNTVEETVTRTSGNVPYRLKKRPPIILIAAALFLIAGTALAIGISAMIGARDRASEAVSSYQAVLEGKGLPEDGANLPGNSVPVPSPYITYSKFQADEDGKWMPDEIRDIDVSAPAGELTVRLTALISRTEFEQLACYLQVEGTKPVPYALTELRLSINGGEPLKTRSELEWEQNHSSYRATPQPVADWNTDNSDTNYLTFPLEGNPLRAGSTFTLTGKLNGEPFTLTYIFTEERYEELRQTQLQEVNAIGAVINAIPDETIPVNVTGCGYMVEEIALVDHFIYFTVTLDPAWPAGKDHPGAPYDTYDQGLWMAVDGMLYEAEFVSAADDENGVNHAIYRAYFPYDEGNLPKESLLSMMRVIFRIDWATKKVTGPVEDVEYNEWRKESMELSAPDYGTDYIAKVSAKADTFRVTQAVFLNNWAGYFALVVETDQAVDKPLHGMDRQPEVTLNGMRLNNHTNYIQDPNDFMGGYDHDGKRVGFWLDAPALRLLPETFEVTVSYNGSQVTFTLHKTDFQPGDAQSGEYHKLFGF